MKYAVVIRNINQGGVGFIDIKTRSEAERIVCTKRLIRLRRLSHILLQPTRAQKNIILNIATLYKNVYWNGPIMYNLPQIRLKYIKMNSFKQYNYVIYLYNVYIICLPNYFYDKNNQRS